jgi:hypothetical protein
MDSSFVVLYVTTREIVASILVAVKPSCKPLEVTECNRTELHIYILQMEESWLNDPAGKDSRFNLS